MIQSQEELADNATNLKAMLKDFFKQEIESTVSLITHMPMDVAARDTGELLSAKAYLGALEALERNLESYTQNYDIQVMREKKWQTRK